MNTQKGPTLHGVQLTLNQQLTNDKKILRIALLACNKIHDKIPDEATEAHGEFGGKLSEPAKA
jgi:hypothetical protein